MNDTGWKAALILFGQRPILGRPCLRFPMTSVGLSRPSAKGAFNFDIFDIEGRCLANLWAFRRIPRVEDKLRNPPFTTLYFRTQQHWGLALYWSFSSRNTFTSNTGRLESLNATRVRRKLRKIVLLILLNLWFPVIHWEDSKSINTSENWLREQVLIELKSLSAT